MKLISMTDFVLEQKEKVNKHAIPYRIESLHKIENYAKFLKQPLELWMFVPCDKNGNVLEEPLHYTEFTRNETNKYQQAKERCLFEGFYVSEGKDTTPTDVKSVTNGKFHFFWFNNIKKWYLSQGFSIIEDLTEERYNIQLTPTALKQIGCDH